MRQNVRRAGGLRQWLGLRRSCVRGTLRYEGAMAVHDFTSERLFVEADLGEGRAVDTADGQANYLLNVLRLKAGAQLLVFNGRDGEWRAEIAEVRKRWCVLRILAQTRPQTSGPDLHYVFAPLKHARLDYMVQKAVELGAGRLSPVLTRRTVPDRVNLDRMRANAIEAAEQCGVLRIPEVDQPVTLERALASWDAQRVLVFCDEEAPISDPVAALSVLKRGAPIAVLIGPEGGFSEEERQLVRSHPFVLRVSLGPRIMRADTAAVAALALVNAVAGDWF
jgi:16S rRNA (uracil1498-N3)-methyltransferase